jgi:hypothetical protein
MTALFKNGTSLKMFVCIVATKYESVVILNRKIKPIGKIFSVSESVWFETERSCLISHCGKVGRG